MAQFVMHRILGATTGKYWDRAKLAFWNIVRRVLVKNGDPLICSEVCGFPLQMPLSHDLPLILRLFPRFASNLGRIAKAIETKYPELTCIDIGANIGDSVAVLRERLELPVLCIEGDMEFFEILKKNMRQFKGISLANLFIGDPHKQMHGSVQKQHGTAGILTDEGTGHTIPLHGLAEVLDQFPAFTRSKLIKIDTDGFDCIIIRSSAEVLKTLRPVLFFEYFPHLLFKQGDDGISVFHALQSLGYQGALLYDRTGEFMFSELLSNERFINELHGYFTDPDGLRHCDLCVFHREDFDLFEKLRSDELLVFKAFHTLSKSNIESKTK